MDDYKVVMDGSKVIGLWNESEYKYRLPEIKESGFSSLKEMKELREEIEILKGEELEDDEEECDEYTLPVKNGCMVISEEQERLMMAFVGIIERSFVKHFFRTFGRYEKEGELND